MRLRIVAIACISLVGCAEEAPLEGLAFYSKCMNYAYDSYHDACDGRTVILGVTQFTASSWNELEVRIPNSTGRYRVLLASPLRDPELLESLVVRGTVEEGGFFASDAFVIEDAIVVSSVPLSTEKIQQQAVAAGRKKVESRALRDCLNQARSITLTGKLNCGVLELADTNHNWASDSTLYTTVQCTTLNAFGTEVPLRFRCVTEGDDTRIESTM